MVETSFPKKVFFFLSVGFFLLSICEEEKIKMKKKVLIDFIIDKHLLYRAMDIDPKIADVLVVTIEDIVSTSSMKEIDELSNTLHVLDNSIMIEEIKGGIKNE